MTEQKRKKVVVTKKELNSNLNHLSNQGKFERAKVQYDKLECMRNGVHSSMELDFDGLLLNLRLLSQKEINQVNMDVRREINSIPEELRYPGFETFIYTKKILSKATTPSPEDLIPFLSEDSIDAMTPDQQMTLMQIWSDFNKDCCPVIDNMSDEDVNNLYEELKKNPQQANNFTPWQLRKVLYLCLIILMRLTDKSSTKLFPEN
jgi:hypothetical protein